MKRFLLPLVIAVSAFSALSVYSQDVATRNLLLRGGNTSVGNIGTLTVTTLTAPRSYSLPDASGTILLTPNATLSPNRILVTNNNGLVVTQNMTAGSLVIGKTDGTYAVGAPTGARGLVVTTGDGTLDFAMPTGTSDALLRYDNVSGAWVASSGATLDGTGNLVINGNTTLGDGATDQVTINGVVSQSGGQVTFGGNVDANAGLDVTGTLSQTGGAVNFSVTSMTIAGLPSTVGSDVVMIDGSNVVTRTPITSLIGADNGITYNENAPNDGKMRLGAPNATGSTLTGNRYVNIGSQSLYFTTNSGANNVMVLNGAPNSNSYGISLFAGEGDDILLSGPTTINTGQNGDLSVISGTTVGSRLDMSSAVASFSYENGAAELRVTLDPSTGIVLSANDGAGSITDVTVGTSELTISGNVGQSNGNVTFAVGNTKTFAVAGTTNINTTGTKTTTIGNGNASAALTASTLTVGATTMNVTAPTITSTSTTSNTINAATLTLNSTAGYNTAIGNSTGTITNTGSSISSTASSGDYTITVQGGLNSDIVFNGVDTDNAPTDVLTINANNEVTRTLMTGTADEGLQYSSGAYRLGHSTNGSAPIVSSRFVRVGAGGTLTYNTAGGNTMLTLANNGDVGISTAGAGTTTIGGAAAGAISAQSASTVGLTAGTTASIASATTNINTGSGNVNVGSATGTNTVLGTTNINATGTNN
ncbi:MAG: beta strand repeat-containing protein, partial [Ignavibacteria bacterium]